MRLFVAIELDDNARSAVAVEQRQLKALLRDSGRLSLKWIRPEHMHLTLAFLGEIDPLRGAAVVDAMSQPIEAPPFAIAFGGLGVFPPSGAPRVLWLGLVRGAREAIDVQRHVTDRLEHLGIAFEERAFHPHLTLARWRDARASGRRSIVTTQKTGDIVRVWVDGVTLMQSRLSPAGPAYTALAHARLGAYPGPPLQSD